MKLLARVNVRPSWSLTAYVSILLVQSVSLCPHRKVFRRFCLGVDAPAVFRPTLKRRLYSQRTIHSLRTECLQVAGEVMSGDVKTSASRWSLGGKVWRAPTGAQLQREQAEATLHELEARRIKVRDKHVSGNGGSVAPAAARMADHSTSA